MKINLISEKYQRYLLVFGAFLIQLSLGSFFKFGHIQDKIVEYMQNYSCSKENANFQSTHWIYGMMVFGVGTTLSLGGFIEKKISSSLTILIGACIFSFNVCLMVVTLNTYLSVVIISYGLFSGFGMGLAYGVSLGVPIKWFPNNKGLIFGITVSGFGISATIFDYLQHSILFPGNKLDIEKLPKSFLILGSIYAILQLIGCILITIKPQENEMNTININAETEIGQSLFFQNSKRCNQIDFAPHQIILEFDFWIMWIIMFMISFWIYFITQVYSRYWKVLPGKDNFIYQLTYVSIIAAATNFCGRIFWGYAIDRKPFKKIMIIINLGSSFFVGTIPVLSLLPEHTIKYIFGLWIIIIYFFFSGIFSVFPAMCAKLYGIKNFVINYGLLYTACSMSGLLVSIVIMTAVPNEIKKPTIFRNFFIIASALLFFAALITLLFRGKSLIIHSK